METKSLKPIRRSMSLRDTAYRALKTAILRGELKPGQQLKEEYLAHQFGISPTPIREALARLEQERLVRTVPYKGAFVTELSPQDIRDIYVVRQTLESWATGLAATEIPAEALAELEELITSVEEAVGQAKRQERPKADVRLHALESDIRFHAVIAECAHNKWLSRVLSTLQDWLRVIRSFSVTELDHIEVSFAEHRDILNALSERDVLGARRSMEQHLGRSQDRVINLLEARRAQEG
jgi:DNA-binding GntR family transcriptional regulator